MNTDDTDLADFHGYYSPFLLILLLNSLKFNRKEHKGIAKFAEFYLSSLFKVICV